MLNADFSERTYTAEVMKTKAKGDAVFNAILQLVDTPKTQVMTDDKGDAEVNLCHGYLRKQHEYHRFAKIITAPDGEKISIPRQKKIKGKQYNLYDVFVAQCKNHIVVAVPFHDLAEKFFIDVDSALAGTNTRYKKIDITQMVIALGAAGSSTTIQSASGDKTTLSVNRCHLTYTEQLNRSSNLQQIRMTGGNLGASDEYKKLIAPVLDPINSALTVTPVILGFSLCVNGVRKSSATTDRHGNFKLWIAPGLRRLMRIFELLNTIEKIKDVSLITSNIPILQAKLIREAED